MQTTRRPDLVIRLLLSLGYLYQLTSLTYQHTLYIDMNNSLWSLYYTSDI